MMEPTQTNPQNSSEPDCVGGDNDSDEETQLRFRAAAKVQELRQRASIGCMKLCPQCHTPTSHADADAAMPLSNLSKSASSEKKKEKKKKTRKLLVCSLCGGSADWLEARSDPHSISRHFRRTGASAAAAAAASAAIINVTPHDNDAPPPTAVHAAQDVCIVYCGTFCPPHEGHLRAARSALEYFRCCDGGSEEGTRSSSGGHKTAHCILSPCREAYVRRKLGVDAIPDSIRILMLEELLSSPEEEQGSISSDRSTGSMSVDLWESSQPSFVPILRVLQHHQEAWPSVAVASQQQQQQQQQQQPSNLGGLTASTTTTVVAALLGSDAVGWPEPLIRQGFSVLVARNRSIHPATAAYLDALRDAFPGQVHLLPILSNDEDIDLSSSRIRAYCKTHGEAPPRNMLPSGLASLVTAYGLWGTGTGNGGSIDTAPSCNTGPTSSNRAPPTLSRKERKLARRRQHEIRSRNSGIDSQLQGLDRSHTPCGYRYDECTSAFQKAIRRSQALDACFWAAQLFMGGRGFQAMQRLVVVAAEDAAFGQPSLVLECQKAADAYTHTTTAEEAKNLLCRTVALAAMSAKSRSVNHAVMSSYCCLEDTMLRGDLGLLELRRHPDALLTRLASCVAEARDEKSIAAEEEALVLCRLCYLERGTLLRRLWGFLLETPLQIKPAQVALDLLRGLYEMDIRANMGDQLFLFMALLVHTRQRYIDFSAQPSQTDMIELERVVDKALSSFFQTGKAGRLLTVPTHALDRHTARGRGATHRFHHCQEGDCIVNDGLVHVGFSTLPSWPMVAVSLGIDESNVAERDKSHGPAMRYALNRQCARQLALGQTHLQALVGSSADSKIGTATPHTLISQFFDEGTKIEGSPEVLPFVTGHLEANAATNNNNMGDPYRPRCKEFYMRIEEQFGSLRAKCQSIVSIQKAQMRALEEACSTPEQLALEDFRRQLIDEAAATTINAHHDSRRYRLRSGMSNGSRISNALIPADWPLGDARVIGIEELYHATFEGATSDRRLCNTENGAVLLGTGFSASIIDAWLVGSGRVAVKWLNLATRGAQRKAIEAQREVRVLSALSGCPHVVKLLGAGQLTSPNPTAFLVLEKADRDAWTKLLAERSTCQQREQPQPTGDWLSILIAATEGLVAMHELGFLHKDFNLQNILLFEQKESPDEDKRVVMTAKLSDFGASIHEDDPPDSFAGHPRLSAPEILREIIKFPSDTVRAAAKFMSPAERHPLHYTRSADVFMLGSALFEVCEGPPPEIPTDRVFHDTSSQVEAACRLVRGERPSLSRSHSTSLVGLMKRCWAQQPSERPTASEALAILQQLRNGETVD